MTGSPAENHRVEAKAAGDDARVGSGAEECGVAADKVDPAGAVAAAASAPATAPADPMEVDEDVGAEAAGDAASGSAAADNLNVSRGICQLGFRCFVRFACCEFGRVALRGREVRRLSGDGFYDMPLIFQN